MGITKTRNKPKLASSSAESTQDAASIVHQLVFDRDALTSYLRSTVDLVANAPSAVLPDEWLPPLSND